MRRTLSALPCVAALICCAAAFSPAAVADDLKVELSKSRGFVRVLVRNTSDHVIKVDKELAYGPDIGLWNIYFEIRDKQGREEDFDAKVDYGSFPKWRALAPNEFVSLRTSKDWLSLDYALDKGEYSVTANYRARSDSGDILRSYRSNPLRMELGGDQKQIWDRLKKADGMVEVDLTGFKKKEPPNVSPPR